MRDVKVRDWGGAPTLSATFRYEERRFEGVSFLLTPINIDDDVVYVGRASIDVRYSDALTCSYPIDLEVRAIRSAAGDLQLFIRDHRPTGFARSLPSGAASCPHNVTNRWNMHPEPFVKRTPIPDFREQAKDLCKLARNRVSSVAGAASLTTTALPLPALPPNVFHASGTWQSKSTPARDATLRAEIKKVMDLAKDGTRGSDGAQMAGRLLAAWQEESEACVVQYVGSTGVPVRLTLTDVVKRAYRLSFDPYHCAELRWGAELASPELATCNTQTPEHLERYEAQQSLRHYLSTPPASAPTPLGSGPAPEEIDLVDYLEQRQVQP
jgi:hypothetical protein